MIIWPDDVLDRVQRLIYFLGVYGEIAIVLIILFAIFTFIAIIIIDNNTRTARNEIRNLRIQLYEQHIEILELNKKNPE